MKHLAILAFFLVLLISIPAISAYTTSWGSYIAVEELTIDYTRFSTTGKTWYPLSKSYSIPVVLGIQANITFNPQATEKKFIISIAGATTSEYIDIAFFDTGIIDIVKTTPSGAVKLGDTSGSGISWKNTEFVIVEIGENIVVKTNNGTVLATVPNTLTSVAQIGASGGEMSLVDGYVYVAVLTNPLEGITNTTYSMMPLMFSLVAIAIPLMFLKYIVRFLEKIF